MRGWGVVMVGRGMEQGAGIGGLCVNMCVCECGTVCTSAASGLCKVCTGNVYEHKEAR